MTCDYALTSKKIPIVPDSIIRYRKIRGQPVESPPEGGYIPFYLNEEGTFLSFLI